MDWSHVDYLWSSVMIMTSFLDSRSDGTHSLQRIHWAALGSLDGLRLSKFSAIMYFGVSYSYNSLCYLPFLCNCL